VIDFGIARAAIGHLTGHTVATGFGELLGTPEYMSPEQAGFDSRLVGPASDTYSLGVLLYELLAGVLPFDPTRLRRSGLTELTRIIREEEAPSPATRLSETGLMSTVAASRNTTQETLRRLLSYDLARVLRACLQKDAKFRYPSTGALAEDIERYLRREPVLAQGPTSAYRLRKRLRRYRVPASALAVAAVVAGLALQFWQLRPRPILLSIYFRLGLQMGSV
jgi:eukaryotic-like serine/threonine-protein kinase